jgi:hypothetical protein
MRKIDNIGELYGMVHELFVETACPKCENISISTMPQAEMILIFGCQNCADIEQSMLTEMDVPTMEIIPKEAMAECINY